MRKGVEMNELSGKTSSEEKISKRELLSFCQLANLDWQFVDLEAVKVEEQSLTLSKALNPNYFRRTTKDIYGEILYDDIAIYGENEVGKEVLRQKIGMTMELLEKKGFGSEEGKYLDEWEVLGGYDNYSIEREIMEEELRKNEATVEKEKKRLSKKIDIFLEKKTTPTTSNWSFTLGQEIFDGVEKKLIKSGQCTEKIRSKKSKILKETEDIDDIEDLESWLSLHIPEREIIEAEITDKLSRERREIIINKVIQVGTIIIFTGISANTNIKNVKKLQRLSSSKQNRSLVNQCKNMTREEMEYFFTEVIKDEQAISEARELYDVIKNLDMDLEKNITKLTVEEHLSNTVKLNIEKTLEETFKYSKEEVKDRVEKWSLEELYMLYVEFFAKKNKVLKYIVQISEKKSYEDTGLRILVLKKGNKIVIALGTSEVEQQKRENVNGYIERGKLSPEKNEVYCSKIRKI